MGPAFKTLLFTFVVPGTATALIPYFMVTRTEAWSIGPIRYAGIPLICVGGSDLRMVRERLRDPRAEEHPRQSIRRRHSSSKGYIGTCAIRCTLAC